MPRRRSAPHAENAATPGTDATDRSAGPAAAPPSAPLPARPRATVAIGLVHGLLAGCAGRGVALPPLLAGAGIDPDCLADPAARVPVERYADLYNAVTRALQDEGFGLFSRPLAPGSFEFLCRSVVSAPDLGEALQRATRFLRVILPDLEVTVRREREAAWLGIREALPLAAPAGRVFAFEWLLRLLHGLACWLVGRGLALDAVAFPYPRPAHADDYALIYTEHSSFDATELTARLAANLLDLPIRRDETALNNFLDGAPGKISMLYRRDREMVLRVRDLLRASLPETLSLDAAARRLHLSPRTLHRRLEEEGSSFRSIKDALRRDLALSRLAKTRHSLARIAADLGYADPSAFYRAFVGWTGESPSRYRRRLQPD